MDIAEIRKSACVVPILNVENIQAAFDFYVHKLGFEKRWDWGEPATFGKVHVLVGPRTLFWKEILREIARATGRKGKWLLPVPTWGIKMVAAIFERFPWFPLTRDQIDMLMDPAAGDINFTLQAG